MKHCVPAIRLRNTPLRYMLLTIFATALVALSPGPGPGGEARAQETPAPALATTAPRVRFDTSMGSFVVQLAPERAPLTVENFLRNARSGFYSGTVFHRVIDNFIAQAGGYGADYKLKPPGAQHVANEAGNGLTNRRGTIAMARTANPHSANCQFYLNLADNPDLDPLPSRWGYAVFGEVVEGMDVVDRIGHVATGAGGEFSQDVPLKAIVIEKATVLDPAAPSTEKTPGPPTPPTK